jgi:AmmeMemoRadiSam system protein B
VLLGPAHRVPLRGLAVPSADSFATPLGDIEVDRAAVACALDLPQVSESDRAHALEHSLEVQLPFLQTLLSSFRLVPLAVGDATAAQVAEVIESLWGGPETLIVVSSDLSHYHAYSEACEIDRRSAQTVLTLSPTLGYDQACGALPINGLITVARRRGLRPELLDLRNSGDTAGDKFRVVGYGSFIFSEAPA